MSRLIPTIAIILSLSACCATPEQARLQLPPSVNYPTISQPELQCLSGDAYRRLVVRDRLKTERITTLENIIKATHQ